VCCSSVSLALGCPEFSLSILTPPQSFIAQGYNGYTVTYSLTIGLKVVGPLYRRGTIARSSQ
jgi:hypothetical protein